ETMTLLFLGTFGRRVLWVGVWIGLLLLLSGGIGFDFTEPRQVFGFDLSGFAVLAPDGVVDFLAVDADRFGGGDAESHLVPSDVDDGDFDVVADNDRLVLLTGQHQHGWLLPGQRGLKRFARSSPRSRVARLPCLAVRRRGGLSDLLIIATGA